MSIIAVKGIPHQWSLKQCVMILIKKVKAIKGQFEAINFKGPYGKFATKVLYLRLSEKLDPQYVIENINTTQFVNNTKLTAYIPDYVPDLKPHVSKPRKQRQRGLQRRQCIFPPGEVLVFTHRELMYELQYKYTGLFKLSKGTGHKLLDNIAGSISERLKFIMQKDPTIQSFALSKSYRKKHPHFIDFQLILATLHRIQDAAGEPRTQISEQDLAVVCTQPNVIGNIPYAKVQKATNKYSEIIIAKITEHIKGLNSEIKTDTDNEEEIARKKVRAELKKITPYLPVMVKQILTDNCATPEKSPYSKFRIYGEPFIPPKETMLPFLKKYNTIKTMRSDRMYNVLRFCVPISHYASLMAMDGTILGGAKLIIRPSDMTLYNPPETLTSQMMDTFKDHKESAEPPQPQPESEEYEEMELPQDDDWNEPWD